MHQSLLNQFRGAYLGAVLGDVLTAAGDREPTPSSALPLGTVALTCTRSWLGEKLDWTAAPTIQRQSPLSAMTVYLTLGLPGALFFHDDLPEFQRQMETQRAIWCPTLAAESPDVIRALEDSGLTTAIILSGILQQRFQPQTAMTTVRRMLASLGRSLGDLEPYLTCIETMLYERQPLAIASVLLAHVSSPHPQLRQALLAVTTGLYVALSSLHDVSLTLRRIQSLPSPFQDPQPSSDDLILENVRQLTSLVAGTIVGAYNGLEGIPLAWRHSLTPGTYHSGQGASLGYLKAYWDVGSEVDVLQLADQVFVQWSGADEYSYFRTIMPTMAIMSPPMYEPG